MAGCVNILRTDKLTELENGLRGQVGRLIARPARRKFVFLYVYCLLAQVGDKKRGHFANDFVKSKK